MLWRESESALDVLQCRLVTYVKGGLQIDKGDSEVAVLAVIGGGTGGHEISLLRAASISDGGEGGIKENPGEELGRADSTH